MRCHDPRVLERSAKFWKICKVLEPIWVVGIIWSTEVRWSWDILTSAVAVKCSWITSQVLTLNVEYFDNCIYWAGQADAQELQKMGVLTTKASGSTSIHVVSDSSSRWRIARSCTEASRIVLNDTLYFQRAWWKVLFGGATPAAIHCQVRESYHLATRTWHKRYLQFGQRSNLLNAHLCGLRYRSCF